MHDLEQLANFAYKMNDFDIAISILKSILDDQGNDIKSEQIKKRLKRFAKILATQNNQLLEENESFVTGNFKTKSYLVDSKLKQKRIQPEFVMNGKSKQIKGEGHKVYEYISFKICQQGFLDKKPALDAALSCRFIHHRNAFLKLGPFKEEQMSEIPYLVLFHDILNETEMTYLVEKSKPTLTQARESVNHNFQNSADKSASERRSIQKAIRTNIPEAEWPGLNSIKDWSGKKYNKINHPLLWKLNNKVALATQLVTNVHGSATDMQVTNYGLAGLCESHMDSNGLWEGDEEILKSKKPKLYIHGDVIATFMAWISNTDAGGGTAFLNLGYERLIMPEKGAALFWYNLHSDGTRNHLSLHTGCPVLKGQKWVLNKWIHQFDNFQKFPCELTPNVPYKDPSKLHYY